MAFRTILAIDSLDGHAILAILTLDGDAVLAVDADTSFTILATDADAASSTRLTIFSILAVYSNLLGRHILIHEDRDVAIFIDLRSQIISRVFMAPFLLSALNLHRATQLSRVFGTRVSSEFQALACQICSGVFCNRLYIADVGCIRLACFCDVTSSIFFNATAYMGDLATVDIDTAIIAKINLGTGRYILALDLGGLLVTDGRDALQVFCQLDFQLAIRRAVDADVAFCQVALRTADDIESVVELLVNDSRIITLELQTVFHGGNLVFTGLVRIDNTGQARSIHTIFTVNTICSIIAVLDGDIDRSTILAVRPGRACQADMADTIFTGNGDSIFAILAGDTDFAVSTICTFRAGNGDTIFARFTIFTIQATDGDTVGAVQANMAIPAVDADLAIFTVFARLADTDVLGQLQIIRNLAIFIRGFMEQDVLASIDVFFRLFILTFTSWRIAFYSQCCMRSAGFISFCTIGFDLCIKSTQVLASRIVCRDIIQCLASFCNRRIIVVQRLARYQLVGSRSIRSSSGRACSEWICTKSLTPGIFVLFLLLWRCICFCNGFSIIADGVGLQISANVGCIRFGIRFQLFHDHCIMGINAVSSFDETIIVGRLIYCIFCSNRILSVIVPRPICID